MSLILVEGAALFAAVAATVFVWGHPLLLDWLDVASLLGQAAILSLCCIVAFYYNDLYDLRVVRSFSQFATRLVQGLGVALVLLAGFYTLFPDMRARDGALVTSLLMIVGLLLPIRAVGYFVMRRRAFSDRVLILGTGPLARKLIEEIEARPHYRYRIVGVADDGQAAEGEPLKYPLLGPLEHLDKIAERGAGRPRLSWPWPSGGGGCPCANSSTPKRRASWSRTAWRPMSISPASWPSRPCRPPSSCSPAGSGRPRASSPSAES